MRNFIAFNPTKLHFGKQVVNELGSAAVTLGKHALLVYGGGSVLRNGSYGDTLAQLNSAGLQVTEFKGIKPNPLVDDVRRAAKLGKESGADLLVAVGGGSVIDSAKIIAVCMSGDYDAWDVMKGKHASLTSLPLIAVLTLAATGTEMNGTSVLQNPETREKIGFNNEVMYPVHSFLDPAYTQSVPPDYTAYGTVDLIAHCLEAWFGNGDATLSDRFVLSIIQEAMEFGPALRKNPDNYELRARIMWAATTALNNTTLHGRQSGDWGVHALGHVLSFLHDTPHGATLSIIYPAWLRTMRVRAKERIELLGSGLFGTSGVEDTIQRLTELFITLGSPVRCQDAGIAKNARREILELMNQTRAGGIHYNLTEAEREEILRYIW
ncbi:MAG: iron-containing alcohol dehydrogenase [Bacteroidota bacterium]